MSNLTLHPSLLREDLARLGLADALEATASSFEVGMIEPDRHILREVLSALRAEEAETPLAEHRHIDDRTGAQAVGGRVVKATRFRRADEPLDGSPGAIGRPRSEVHVPWQTSTRCGQRRWRDDPS
jgi:FMN phosphatase YigB (HAD superfamily)